MISVTYCQVYMLVIRAKLISQVYNEIRRVRHDNLWMSLKDTLRRGIPTERDTDPEELEESLLQSVKAAEKQAVEATFQPLRDMEACFHERMLRQALDDAVLLFSDDENDNQSSAEDVEHVAAV